MRIEIERRWKKAGYSIGRIYVDNAYICNTLEDRDRGLHQNMSEADIRARKLYGETAIPLGTYDVRLTISNKFKDRYWAKRYGGKVPEIMGVKGFSGVRIHPANKPSELEGCIAVGLNTIKGQVTSSVKWYQILMQDYIYPAVKRGERITLTIR